MKLLLSFVLSIRFVFYENGILVVLFLLVKTRFNQTLFISIVYAKSNDQHLARMRSDHYYPLLITSDNIVVPHIKS